MNLWNVRELPIPPINTYKAPNKDIDIKFLHQVCREVQDFFDNNKYLHTEQSILTRIIYRMKTKFRSAKDFKAVEKVNKAVDIFLNISISSNLNTFMSLIPSRYKDDTYLPSKNLLDYILVRLQGAAKLLERIVESCKICAYLLDKRMHIGHFWRLAFMLFSVVSRIYILAKYTTERVCEFYGKLLPFSSKLLNVSKTFLPDGYELPADLKEWMNVDWIEFHEEIQHFEEPTNIPDIMEFFDLIHDDSDVEFCNEYVLVEDDDIVDLVNESKKKKAASKSEYINDLKGLRGFGIDDIGEIIEINNGVHKSSGGQSLIVLSDNSSGFESEDSVEVDKKSNSIIMLSDESDLEVPRLNKMKKFKSKKIFKNLNNTNFQNEQDNLENEVYSYEKMSLEKTSKNNQNQLTLKRKANLDLGSKAKKRKLLNLHESISDVENDLEIKDKSKGAVLQNLKKPKPLKSKSNEKKNSKKKKPNDTHQLDLNFKISETGSSSKALQSVDIYKSNFKKKNKKKGIKVVPSDAPVTIQSKQSVQNKQYNLENEVYSYEKNAWKKKSKNNQNQLTLKRKVNSDLGPKAKKRKLLNNEIYSEIKEKSQKAVVGNLNKPKPMKGKSNVNNIHRLELNIKNSETGSSSKALQKKKNKKRRKKVVQSDAPVTIQSKQSVQNKQYNLENEVHSYEKNTLEKKSKNNQNQLTLKRKVDIHLGTKAKKRKLSNLHESLSNNENNLEIKDKSKGAVLQNLNKPKPMKTKSNEKKNSKKKKPNDTHRLDLNVKNSETGSSSKALQSVDIDKSNFKKKNKKKGIKVVQSDAPITIQSKQSVQNKHYNLENEVYSYEKNPLKKKSKNNQNQLTLKRKVNSDLVSKKRKLVNNEIYSEIKEKSKKAVVGNLNKPKPMKGKSNVNNMHRSESNVKNGETGSSSKELQKKKNKKRRKKVVQSDAPVTVQIKSVPIKKKRKKRRKRNKKATIS